ncbi:MAG TPA: response regulator transcription factor, partial [Aminobacteriaceae bacterium]|nr:response regulator transcription factor [Aminobacteriaceae bacterium]
AAWNHWASGTALKKLAPLRWLSQNSIFSLPTSKYFGHEEITRAINTVAKGGFYLDSEVASAMGDGEFTPEQLSAREREVLILASKGFSSKEVAARLFISERTVQTHLASIYDKLGAKNKTEALLLALKYGVVTLEELLE